MAKKNKQKETTEETPMQDLLPAEEEAVTPEYLGTTGADYSNLTVVEQEAYKCRDALIEAAKSEKTTFIVLAENLLKAYEHKEEYQGVWGLNFVDFVEQKLDMDQARAYMFVDIARFVRDKGLDFEKVNKIGWTKMSIISRAVRRNEELDYQPLLELAEAGATVKEITDDIKESTEAKMTEGKDATADKLKLALVYEDEEARRVNEALHKACAEDNLDPTAKGSIKAAMSKIAMDWLALRGSNLEHTTLADWIGYIEQKFGVKLVQTIEESSIESVVGGFEAQKDAESIESMLDGDDELSKLLGATPIPN